MEIDQTRLNDCCDSVWIITEVIDDQTMTKRAFGTAVLSILSSGSFVLGHASEDRVVTDVSMVEEFKGARAELSKKRPWGFYVDVMGQFDEPVDGETVTVTFKKSEDDPITERSFEVSGRTFSRTFRLWRFPEQAWFSRE